MKYFCIVESLEPRRLLSTLVQLTEGTTGPLLSHPDLLGAFNEQLFFRATTNRLVGIEPFFSNGTNAGTRLLKDVYPGGTNSLPGLLVQCGTQAFFIADSPSVGRELWVTDGTSAGTRLVKDIRLGSASSSIGQMVAMDNKLYFWANDGVNGARLWISDGTSSGTSIVSNSLMPPTFGGEMLALNGYLYFVAGPTQNDQELWKTDGTAGGTSIVKDILTSAGSNGPGYLTAVGDLIYFRATDGSESGAQLWRSDGTGGGTFRVKNIDPGNNLSNIINPQAVGGLLYFQGTTAAHGAELWRSDGTTDGTVMVHDVRPGPEGSYPSMYESINGRMIFVANDGVNGGALWGTDGSAAGTVMVADPSSGTSVDSSDLSQSYAVADGRIHFSVFGTGGLTGQTLWETDGTTQGTVKVPPPPDQLNLGTTGAVAAAGGSVFINATPNGQQYYLYRYNRSPQVLSSSVTHNWAGTTITVRFSENVGSQISSTDLTLVNQTTAASINSTSVTFDTATNTAVFSFPSASLSEGNYRAQMPADSVRDSVDQPLAAGLNLDFYRLGGDANGDRHVDANDEAIFNSNFGQSGRTYAQGDFDYNGTVNDEDRAILNANLSVWLPPQGSTIGLPDDVSSTYRLRRESPTLLAAFDSAAGTGTPKYRIRLDAVGGITFTTSSPAVLVADYSNGSLLNTGRIDFTGGSSNDMLSVIGSIGAEQIAFDGLDVTVGAGVLRYGGVETVTFDGKGGWDSLSVGGAQTLSILGAQELQDLLIAGGATASVPADADGALIARRLIIDATGNLNLADNDLLIDYTDTTPYSQIRQYIMDGRSSGVGIISSIGDAKRVVAPVDNTQFGRTSWNGQQIDQSTIIVTYTYYGDSNLDGKVTGDDYVAIDSNLGKTDAQWIHGDFNFDGRTSGDDYVSIDANLGMGTTNPASFDELQAEMVSIHADRYGGKSYVKEVEKAAGEKVKHKPTRPAPRGRR